MITLNSVLLVDDNQTFLRLVRRFLEEQGAHELRVVGVAHTGDKALAQARELQPQVILLDLALAGSSGLDIISPLRQLLPKVIIIVLSLLDAAAYRPAALAAGADDFVSKATLSTDLLPAIRQRVRAQQLRPERP